MSRVNPWWGGDWTQSHAINDLDEELAAERAARRRQTRRLDQARSELDRGIQQVDARLGSVSERIEAVLDWTELRFQLGEFDEYQARKAIRKTVRALAQGRPARSPALEDVPGYWLPPAAAAVLPLILRDRPAIPAQRTGANPFPDLKAGLEAARERDEVRAELFNLAVGRCFDQPVLIDVAVLRLLTGPSDLGVAEPGSVAAAWRTLWVHTACGDFGPGAAVQLEGLLRERFDPGTFDDEDLQAWDRMIANFGATEGQPLPRAEAYAALEAHLAATAEPAEPRDDEAWRRYLQELIEEPSPAELPLVREMEALDLETESPQHSRPSWAEPAGTAASLLRRDLFDPDGPVPLRRLALDLAAPLLRSRLTQLEAGLGTTETVVITVKRRGATVDVAREGHDPEQLAEVERRIGLAYSAAGSSKPTTIAYAAGLGAVAVLFLAFGQWFLGTLFALAVSIPLFLHHKRGIETAETLARRDEQLAEARGALVKARKDAEQQECEATERGTATRKALEHLRESLPAEHRPESH